MAGEVVNGAGGSGATPFTPKSRGRGEMPGGTIGPDDAGEWLQGKLLAERAAIIQLMENRHSALIGEFRAQCSGLSEDPFATIVSRANSELCAWRSVSIQRTCRSPNKMGGDNDIGGQLMEPEEEHATGGIDVMLPEHGDGHHQGKSMAKLKQIINSVQFEITFGCLIILNTLIMAIQQQYQGLVNAHSVSYHGEARPAEEVWPGADQIFKVIELLFGTLFTVEIVLKMVILGWVFFKETWWNWYDTVIVIVWICDNYVTIPFDPMILRLARISRLLRLLRILKWMNLFDPLILMVKAIKSSASLLAWSMLILGLVTSVLAMAVSQMLERFIRDEDVPILTRTKVFESWGSFSRALETMFEVTLANWGPPCQLLMNNVSEWWLLFFLIYKFSVGFAVVQVLMAVFIQQTFKVASRDEEVMIKEKMATAKANLKHLDGLFKAMDSSGDGYITRDEFQQVLQDQRIKMWFSALDVDISEVEKLFDLLDDGDGEIAKDEFFAGVQSCKGAAKVTDMMGMMKMQKAQNRLILSLGDRLDQLSAIQSYQASLAFNSASGKAPSGVRRHDSQQVVPGGDPWQGGEWQCNVSEADQG